MNSTKAAAAAPKSNGRTVAIITMFFMFAMISFVTNMAAPFGNIWSFKYEWAGMAGNLMNFTAHMRQRPGHPAPLECGGRQCRCDRR